MFTMLPKLKEDDYLHESFDFWKEYRKALTKKCTTSEIKLEKTSENIYIKAKEIGIKPAARYFNVTPKTIRYHIEKYEKRNNI